MRQSPLQMLILLPNSSPLTAFKFFKISSGSGLGVQELRRLPFEEYGTGGISERNLFRYLLSIDRMIAQKLKGSWMISPTSKPLIPRFVPFTSKSSHLADNPNLHTFL